MNVPKFKNSKNIRFLSMVTCYDASFAKALEKTNIDSILVGDSVAMVIYGEKSTINATVEMIANHVKAVRSSYSGLIVADIPFLSTQKDQTAFIKDIQKIMCAGANAVKIEGVYGVENKIKSLINAGVPVMGHVGLTPQFINKFGGFKVQGRDFESEKQIISHGEKLEELGCYSVVLECVPSKISSALTKKLSIPTIGIGAGLSTDGQILVLQDLLGLSDVNLKFVKQFENFMEKTVSAVNQYCLEVNEEKFPKEENTFL